MRFAKRPSNDHEIAKSGRRLNHASHVVSIRRRCIALIAKGTDLMSIYKTRRATILLCSVAVAVLATSAIATPLHHRHRVAQAPQVAGQSFTGADRDVRYSANMSQAAYRLLPKVKASAAAMLAGHRPVPGRAHSRTRIRPMAGRRATRWLPRRANTSGPTRLDAAAFGAALSWTWCLSAPAMPAAAISRCLRPLRNPCRRATGRRYRRDGTPRWRPCRCRQRC